jgi:hypothetical protein
LGGGGGGEKLLKGKNTFTMKYEELTREVEEYHKGEICVCCLITVSGLNKQCYTDYKIYPTYPNVKILCKEIFIKICRGKSQISLISDKKYRVLHAKAAVGVTMFTARYFRPILTKSGFLRQILNKSLIFQKISQKKNLSSRNRFDTFGGTDRHT